MRSGVDEEKAALAEESAIRKAARTERNARICAHVAKNQDVPLRDVARAFGVPPATVREALGLRKKR